MRYIAKKVEDYYEITHINSLETPNGDKVEVVIGKTKPKKEQLEKAIKDYEEETKMMLEQRTQEINELKEILKSINKIK